VPNKRPPNPPYFRLCATRGNVITLTTPGRCEQVKRLEELLQAAPWTSGFTIWNAGREGRRLYRSLSEGARRRVRALCDVDAKKLAQREWHAHPLDTRVPIVHFRHATPPLLLCVKVTDKRTRKRA